MSVKSYLLSLPERLVRSTVGLGAGLTREVADVALPDGIRRGQLYQSLVDATLRYLIEQVGGADGAYAAGDRLPDEPGLPSRESLTALWQQLKTEAAHQDRSVLETSSMLAVSAARGLPERVRYLSASARVGASRAGYVLGAALLDHYRHTLGEIQQTGYATYAARQLRPYVRAAVAQFSPRRRTLTERLLDRIDRRRRHGLPGS